MRSTGDTHRAAHRKVWNMTDVREPEGTEAIAAPEMELAPRRTLVARALEPIRRVTSRELAPVWKGDAQFRGSNPFKLQPVNKINVIRWSAIVVIALPMFLTAVYLFFIASDQYVAETRFAVRQAGAMAGQSMRTGDEGKTGSPSSGSFSMGLPDLGGEDAEIVANYIHSRAIIEDVGNSVDIRAIFRRPNADFWARLPADASIETLTTYWNKMVSVYLESSSGIVTVSVSAFDREDALTLVDAVLKSSSALANSMSLKIRMDAIKTAEDEVRRAEGQVRFSLADMTAFRNAEHLIDPVQASASSAKLLMQLMSDKIETEGRLFVALRLQGPNAPGIASLHAKLDSDNIQITKLNDEIAGDKTVSKNMASTVARFETLELQHQFAVRMYGFARDGVERARIASIRQQIYLAVFVAPSLPQDFTYPLRWTDFILISVLALMTWVCGVTLTASVLDHRL